MTDDEMSEFAEALDDACRGRSDVHTTFFDLFGDINWCPLGALFKTNERPSEPEECPGIPADVMLGFIDGYDGKAPKKRGDQRAFALGRLFRELYP